MASYSVEPKTWKKLANNYGRQLLQAATITRSDTLKTATKTVAHKAAEAKGEFTGNAIANKGKYYKNGHSKMSKLSKPLNNSGASN